MYMQGYYKSDSRVLDKSWKYYYTSEKQWYIRYTNNERRIFDFLDGRRYFISVRTCIKLAAICI
jgi:hypothetical protein